MAALGRFRSFASGGSFGLCSRIVLIVYSGDMGRPDRHQLIEMALAVLEEAAALSRHRPPDKTRGIALALACLAFIREKPDRWFFDEFWRALSDDCRVARPARLNAALTAIYDAIGCQREVKVISHFQQAANLIYGPPSTG